MNSKHDNLWDLLMKYNFEIKGKNSHDLMCVICQRLLVNAYQSCCGCRYCFECIEKYLEGKKKLCPGSGEECKEQLINIYDVQIDHVANVKISKVPVKCPESFCQFSDELRRIEDHINSHQIKCPYFEIGCSKLDINNSNIKNHMNFEQGNHAMLLMDSIQNTKNDISSLRENSLKIEEVKSMIQELMENMKIANNRNDRIIETLSKENFENQDVVNILKNEISNLNNEFKKVKKTLHKKEIQINTITQKLSKLTDELQKSSIEKQVSIKTNICKKTNDPPNYLGFQSKPTTFSINYSPINKTNISDENKTSIIEFPNRINGDWYSPFIWKIDNFSNKRAVAKNAGNSFILSDPFYSHGNGYKICLALYPDGSVVSKNAWLCVGFHLMPSDHDDILSWPMMMNVTIGLVNQKSNEIFLSETFHYTYTPDNNKCRFCKPVFGMNSAVIANEFIKLNAILSNGNLCKKDCIIIKCIVENNTTNANINPVNYYSISSFSNR